MSGWPLFWYIVLATAICCYFGLACVITIGGFFDLKKMFRRLNEARTSEGSHEQTSDTTPSESDHHGTPKSGTPPLPDKDL